MASRTSGATADGVTGQRPSLRAWAELARISNLPTCVSNTLVGAAIAVTAVPGRVWPWPETVLAAVGIGLLYVAGMALNDVADLRIDRVERPARPIPSGRIRRRAATLFVIVCLAAGLSIFAAFGFAALGFAAVLVVSIVAYDLLHSRSVASVVLMGACRGLVYLATAATIAWPFDLELAAWLAVTIAAYTVAISIVARDEMGARERDWRALAGAMPLLVLWPALAIRPDAWLWPAVLGAVLATWLIFPVVFVGRRPPRKIAAVLAWLAGMCLVDGYFVALLGFSLPSAIAVACFALTAWGHRHVMGT